MIHTPEPIDPRTHLQIRRGLDLLESHWETLLSECDLVHQWHLIEEAYSNLSYLHNLRIGLERAQRGYVDNAPPPPPEMPVEDE